LTLAIVSCVVLRAFSGTSYPAAGRGKLQAWRLKRALDYIDAHYAEPIGLIDIARNVGLTPMHFAAQFRRTTGSRPRDVLIRRRIDAARVLLRAPGVRVLDIASQCGFVTQPHFASVFKRIVGVTPTEWRRASTAPNCPKRSL